jgi:uncharacterized membrane protein HdeD (DUF308 family)
MDTVVGTVSRGWWLFLIQGVIGIVLGILALIWPGRTLFTLIVIFGIFFLLGGVVGIFAAIGTAAAREPWAWLLVKAIIGVAAGLAILKWPGVTALVILFLVGTVAIITGVVEIVEAIVDHSEMPQAWLVALAGVVSLLFGVAMLAWPAPVGLVTLAYLVGLYAIAYGVVTCLIAFRVRSLREHIAGAPAPGGELPAT